MMKKFITLIKRSKAASLLPLNFFFGDATPVMEEKIKNDGFEYIRSNRMSTDMLFIDKYYKPISKIINKKYETDK